MTSKIIGYSGFDSSEECYEYFENSCYIADTPQSAKNLMRNSYSCLGKYRIDPVTIDQIMDDFGASCGDYAMEKQAELNTARNEINRLASLYADVQSEKVEAQEALSSVRRELDEERAKLQRYEKLGSGSDTDAIHSTESNGVGHPNARVDNGNTNIEYLKNIMMSFLNAKTLTERKSLVPVIGAVLCLTKEEQAKAIQNIESSGGIEGFSTALFETLGSRR